MKKHILIVSQYFYPEQFRINDIAQELVSKGNEVTVLTGLPNYPIGEIYEGYEKSYKSDYFYEGARVIRCKIRPRHKGAINLILNYFSFVIAARKKARKLKDKYDVIFVYGVSPVTQCLPAISIKRKLNIPIVYYNLDLWPEAVRGAYQNHKQKSKHNILYIFAKFLTKYIYKNVDLIINKCSDFLEYNKNILNIKTEQVVLYEHAEKSYLNVNPFPIDNQIIDIYFMGNIGKVQNCDQIIIAFSKCVFVKKTNLHFVGDGSFKNQCVELVRNLNLENKVFFHNRCSVEEIINYYNLADICILSLSNKTETGLTIPAKLTGYMAASRFIIASINGESKKIIENAECGLCCIADDIDQLTKIMEQSVNNFDYYKMYGINGRKFFLKEFTLDNYITQLQQLLNKIIEKR